MKCTMKKLLACLLCLSLLFGTGTLSVHAAAPKPENATISFVYDLADFILKTLVKGIAMLYPAKGIPDEMPPSDNFYPGTAEFDRSAPLGGDWQLGYADACLTEGIDVLGETYYIAGGLEPLGDRVVKEILDPPMVFATALSDGRSGTVLFLSLDAFGLTSVDVGNIRAALRDFAAANNIVSINVSSLHQHSTIDTLGMNGNLVGGLLWNGLAMATGKFAPFVGKNPKYMENLTAVTADAAMRAVNGMTPGTLSYGKADVGQYLVDKRKPEKLDPYFHRLRFVPNDGSPETWLCNLGVHASVMEDSGTRISSDWPYFAGKTIRERAGANFQLILGAQSAVDTNDRDLAETDYERTEICGTLFAEALLGIPQSAEAPVSARLNITHKEYTMPVDNAMHILMLRMGVIAPTVRKLNRFALQMEVKTELGYLELGDNLAVAIIPGELDPCLAFGGKLSAEEAYRGTEFTFTPMQETVGERELLIFGLTNDQLGYMILPNDLSHFFRFGIQEINTISSEVTPLTLKAFEALIAAVK